MLNRVKFLALTSASIIFVCAPLVAHADNKCERFIENAAALKLGDLRGIELSPYDDISRAKMTHAHNLTTGETFEVLEIPQERRRARHIKEYFRRSPDSKWAKIWDNGDDRFNLPAGVYRFESTLSPRWKDKTALVSAESTVIGEEAVKVHLTALHETLSRHADLVKEIVRSKFLKATDLEVARVYKIKNLKTSEVFDIIQNPNPFQEGMENDFVILPNGLIALRNITPGMYQAEFPGKRQRLSFTISKSLFSREPKFKVVANPDTATESSQPTITQIFNQYWGTLHPDEKKSVVTFLQASVLDNPSSFSNFREKPETVLANLQSMASQPAAMDYQFLKGDPARLFTEFLTSVQEAGRLKELSQVKDLKSFLDEKR